MLQGAADAVKARTAARVAEQEEQLAKPTSPGLITGIPENLIGTLDEVNLNQVPDQTNNSTTEQPS